jgi:hypothetical protein
MNNGPIGGRCSETYSYPTDTIIIPLVVEKENDGSNYAAITVNTCKLNKNCEAFLAKDWHCRG